MKKIMRFLRKTHKWAGIIVLFFLLFFSLSGILLNHRQTISGIQVDREQLPQEYHIQNWNNAALRGKLQLSPDSV